MHIAQNMIQGLSKIPKERVRSTSPFLHYFVSATMISLGLVIKEPSFKAAYGNSILQAARMLRAYCRQTWMSGRMARTIYRLNQMATRALNEDSERQSSRQLPIIEDSTVQNSSAAPIIEPPTTEIHPQQNTSCF